MSARVFKPIPLAEVHKLRAAPADGGCFPYNKGVQKVRRVLFARPDADETKRFLQEEFARLGARNQDRWGFDFAAGEPCTATTGRYEWMKIVNSNPLARNPPARPVKQPPGAAACFDDELYAPIPSSSAAVVEEDAQEALADDVRRASDEMPKKQSLITDFMQARKRIDEASFKKKLDTSNTSRPKKMARMSLADSAS